MAKKALSIVETAYRATIEEQDDTIVWINHAMKGAGADLTVLLRGNAVNMALKAQDPSGLAFGATTQRNPPDLAGDLAKLGAKGVKVYAVQEDITDRGIHGGELVDGVEPISKSKLPKLFGEFDLIWHW
jgi:intracellular sulfur oxidation DsrE/DsrF family protein